MDIVEKVEAVKRETLDSLADLINQDNFNEYNEALSEADPTWGKNSPSGAIKQRDLTQKDKKRKAFWSAINANGIPGDKGERLPLVDEFRDIFKSLVVHLENRETRGNVLDILFDFFAKITIIIEGGGR